MIFCHFDFEMTSLANHAQIQGLNKNQIYYIDELSVPEIRKQYHQKVGFPQWLKHEISVCECLTATKTASLRIT